MAKKSGSDLAARVKRGDHAAASRALSFVIDEDPRADALSREFFSESGSVQKVGLCGPPGSGKSTLLGRLVGLYRRRGLTVGVLAVDPTSHLSGGAFLGDRLRIQEFATDPGVFIRSVATRGMIGGLSYTIFGAIHVLEAFGCDKILVETVGTGQDEVEVARVGDTVLYVTAPQMGDEIQAMKAGIMEIGDVFVVNKADLAGKDKALSDLRSGLSLAPSSQAREWPPPVVATSATLGEGIEPLGRILDDHWSYLRRGPEGVRRLRCQHREELSLYISRRVYQNALNRITEAQLDDLAARKTDPATLGSKILKNPPLRRSRG